MAIQSLFDQFWASIIEDLQIDVFHKKITMVLKTTDNNCVKENRIVFQNCSGFLWVEEPQWYNCNDSFDFTKWEYYELTSITYLQKQMIINTEDKWMKQYSNTYNVAIEIWESGLLINAGTVIVNDAEYRLE